MQYLCTVPCFSAQCLALVQCVTQCAVFVQGVTHTAESFTTVTLLFIFGAGTRRLFQVQFECVTPPLVNNDAMFRSRCDSGPFLSPRQVDRDMVETRVPVIPKHKTRLPTYFSHFLTCRQHLCSLGSRGVDGRFEPRPAKSNSCREDHDSHTPRKIPGWTNRRSG